MSKRLDNATCWSGVGKGWLPIVEALDEYLAHIDPDYIVDQYKEKFGTLRFYFRGNMERYDEMSSAVGFAEYLSGRTCEDCGAPGRLQSIGGWYRTLCITCEEHAIERRRQRRDSAGPVE